ncbi:MAG: hypothetical protein LBP83_00345 [Dysgonamonadaceae bacterium]|nr:hypothetical protein [Dysgonamonadaceae bacterium]
MKFVSVSQGQIIAEGEVIVSVLGHPIGNLFTLLKDDELISITVLFGEVPEKENEELKINVYSINYDLSIAIGAYFLGEPIYTERVKRPVGGFQT